MTIIGYDVGSISVNRVVIDGDGNTIDVLGYARHHGDPAKLIKKDLEYIRDKLGIDQIDSIGFTGSGGKNLSNVLGGDFTNEIEAINTSISRLHQDIKTVIEIGGQDSKFIDLAVGDYAMNELCAAGTGSFLDQQATRFGLSIEEFAELALKSKSPATIAGRCSVFAKSDMIHLQQEATKDEDIAMGLCYAMARSFKSGIVKGKKFVPPIMFCGGVSYNKAMVKAFGDVLGEKIHIPKHRESMGAFGTAFSIMDKNADEKKKINDLLEKIDAHIDNFKYEKETFKKLEIIKSELPDSDQSEYEFGDKKVDAYIGIDVGSISTNVVAIDKKRRLIAKCYLRTSGRPIEAVRKGIEIIGAKVGDKIDVKAVGTTGSGRYLIGDFVGADTVINEITAQATAAADIDDTVDTIFEIGGQDSKYISLEKGVVVDFEMNKICAAGTGSFLEEQSERFDIDIKDFGDIALRAKNPLNLGERCTVFMETNVYSHYQKGASIENILAGLAYSIAINYINRVVARKKIGNKIFFQGAVAFNRSVVAAFEKYLGKKIIVPRHHEVTGAIGTAIAALKEQKENTNFRGFGVISEVEYSQSSFECKGCANMCDIKKVSVEGAPPLYYGGRCEKYENKKKKTFDLPDLFDEREGILLESYEEGRNKGSKKIGIPFTMLTHEFFPFWNSFFTSLGFEVVLSDKTNKKIISRGLASVVAETCFPMKTVMGHIEDLTEKEVDYYFVPSIRDMPCDDDRIEGERTGSYPCPFVQGMSSIIKASLQIDKEKILDPLINFSFRDFLVSEQLKNLGKRLGKNKKDVSDAVGKAYQAQETFHKKIKARGRQLLKDMDEEDIAVVIVSRPYNSCDRSISMDIPKKIRDLGMQAIPLDYLPLDSIDLFDEWPNMYWEFGDRIMSAVEIINSDKRLYPAYITNFGCGPDSFIMQYFERAIEKPFLKIEVDEHTAGAGVITRCEAFADSLKNLRQLKNTHQPSNMLELRPHRTTDPGFKRKDDRTIFIPYMGDGAYAIRSAFRSVGVKAEVMQSDDETLELGRKHTLGKECYPFIITTGDMLKTLKKNDPSKTAFLMPLTYGPCRFGQYNKLQKIIVNEMGYDDVPIISPGAPESDQFYKEYDMSGAKGYRTLIKALCGTFTVDMLHKCLRQVRPYEVKKGITNEVYKKYLDELLEYLEGKTTGSDVLEGMVGILERARVDFESIEQTGEKKPLIGIVGEIYVRNHPYSNNNIIDSIEELGGEVEIPTFGEWPNHTNATSKLDITMKQKNLYYKFLSSLSGNNGSNGSGSIRILKNLFKGSKFYIANRIFKRTLNKYHHALEKPLEGFLRKPGEADIQEVWDNAEPYIIKWFGEAALSIGKSVEWFKEGIDGVVNVMPFTCMPGTIVTAVSKRLREEYKVPWLNLAFDGLEQGTTEIRLEAFMYQAKEHMSKKSKTKIR